MKPNSTVSEQHPLQNSLGLYYTDQSIQILRGLSAWTSTKPSCSTSFRELLQTDNYPITAEREETPPKEIYDCQFLAVVLTSPSSPHFNPTSINKEKWFHQNFGCHTFLNTVRSPHCSFLIRHLLCSLTRPWGLSNVFSR